MLCDSPEFRNGLIQMLSSEGIWVSAWYPRVDKIFAYSQGPFPGGEYFEQRVINLFVDQKVDDKYVARSIALINRYRGSS